MHFIFYSYDSRNTFVLLFEAMLTSSHIICYFTSFPPMLFILVSVFLWIACYVFQINWRKFPLPSQWYRFVLHFEFECTCTRNIRQTRFIGLCIEMTRMCVFMSFNLRYFCLSSGCTSLSCEPNPVYCVVRVGMPLSLILIYLNLFNARRKKNIWFFAHIVQILGEYESQARVRVGVVNMSLWL